MHAFLETSVFSRRADALLSPEERADLIAKLATDPMAGELIPGLGGIRKLRFAAGGRGKSKAFRIIYYVLTDDFPILALLIYGKNEQAHPTAEQSRAMTRLVAELKARAQLGAAEED